MLNEAEIEQYMKNKGVMYGENASIVGIVMPNKISYFTGEAIIIEANY